ncbi:MAG: hypothetical protein AB1457_12595 [Chloroflexota bacterium]
MFWQKAGVILRVGLALVLAGLMPAGTRGASAFGQPSHLPQPAQVSKPQNTLEIRAETYGLPLHNDEWTAAYPKPAIRLERGQRIEVEFQVEEYGEYLLFMDVLAAPDLIGAPEGVLQVDGQLPAADVPRVVFPVYYQNESDQFPLDRYGNPILIPQQRLMAWSRMPLRDVTFSRSLPVTLFLEAGRHSLSLEITKESLYLGSIYL